MTISQHCIRQTGIAAAIASSLLFAATAHAQCAFDWQPGQGSAGPNGVVFTMIRASNGDLIAGGNFTVADNAVVNGIARYDGTTWQAIGGGGVEGMVFKLVEMPNGDIIAAGQLQQAGGMPVGNIARWNGSSWSSLGSGMDSPVLDLAVLANGNLVASGAFAFAGSVAVERIAMWDGANWSAMGSTPGLTINSITVNPSGELLAGGYASPGVPDIVKWNGTSWVALPGLATNSLVSVDKIFAMSNGDLAIRADLVLASGQRLGIWNGSQLQALPQPSAPVTTITSFAEVSNGDLLVASGFSDGIVSVVSRFNGSSWIGLGVNGPNFITSMVVSPSDEIFVAGRQSVLAQDSGVARYQSGIWMPIGGPGAAKVNGVERLADGAVVVAGLFASIGGVAANNIARWNGTTYQPLGLGVNGEVTGLGLANDGRLLVSGNFSGAGGAPAQRIAAWNGFNWATIGAGLDVPATRIAQDQAGDLVALTSDLSQRFRVYDGQSWTAVSGPVGTPNDLVRTPDGVVAIGQFITLSPTTQLSSAARYSNGSFFAVAESNLTTGFAAAVSPTGVLAIGGVAFGGASVFALTSQGPQAIGVWPFTTTPPEALHYLPNGDLIAVGGFGPSASSSAVGVARFDGSNWVEIDGGLGGIANDLAFSDAGELFAAGGFEVAGGHVSVGLARATTNCPASIVSFGSGCMGSAGAMQLTPESQPWLGSRLATTASGFPQQSFGIHVVGLPTVSMALPFAAPGCSLQLAPLQIDLLLPNAGTATANFLIPNVAPLVGQVFRTQAIGLELDSSGNLQQLTATNALQLTIGAF